MQDCYLLLADGVLVVHIAIVVFNIGALPFIWLGCRRNWRLAHNFTFRLSHLLLVGYVAMEAAFGMICPLTRLEDALRMRAGAGDVYEGGFVSHWLHRMLFWDVSQTFLASIYGIFFALVVLTFFYVRPGRPAVSPAPPNPARL